MSVNKIILLGNLGKDPEVKYTADQFCIANFSLATSSRRKEKSGDWKDHTEWHNIVVLGKSAENAAKYLKKGSQAYIEGKVQTRKWTDKEGKDRYTTEVVADSVQFVGSKPKDSATDSGSYSEPMPEPQTQAAQTSFEDDDIPF